MSTTRTERRVVLLVTPANARGLDRALADAHAGDRLDVLVMAEPGEAPPGGARAVVDVRDPEALARTVAHLPRPDVVYFLGGVQATPFAVHDPSALERAQQRGVLSLFRLVKALHAPLAAGSTTWRILTTDTHAVSAGHPGQPGAASIYGFLKVMTQEYRKAAIGAFDLDLAGAPPQLSLDAARALLEPMLRLPLEPGLTEAAFRDGLRYTRVLETVALPEVESPPFRQDGAYVILGGAGGIGTVLSRWLAETYRATLVWVGRRPLPSGKQEAIASIRAAGGQVHYVQADATDAEALASALEPVRRAVGGAFHGAVHSAIVLRDQLIERMAEDAFRQALAPKVQGSVALYRALEHDPLDFLLFFSSAQSFAANPGQSNYAAGCAFKDAFAAWLAARCAFPVRTVNWGYWGSVGIVASEAYRKKLEARGVHSIEPEEGIEAVRRVLSHPVEQVMAFKGTDRLLVDIGVAAGHERRLYPEVSPSLFEEATRPVPPLRADPAVWAAVKAFGRRGLVAALGAMGAFPRAGERLVADALAARLRLKPSYGRLFQALTDLLIEAGALARESGALLVTSLAEAGARLPFDAVEAEREALVERHPQMRALVDLVWTCVQSFPTVLPGTRPATDVLFPGSSTRLLDDIYRNNATADHYNRAVATVARRFAEARTRAAGAGRVRILEVGAGTGGTTAHVLPGLADLGDRVEYVYSDISRAFLSHGKKHFGAAHPYVRFALLDVERDPTSQDLEGGAFDLVIGTNVLHATRRVGDTLASLKVALKRNGCIVINEATSVEEWNTLTFGLLDGWWAYHDEAVRLRNAPLLSVPLWSAVLRSEGFSRVAALATPTTDDGMPTQAVIVAESDGLVKRPRNVEGASVSPPARAAWSGPARPGALPPAATGTPAPPPAVTTSPRAVKAAPGAADGSSAAGRIRSVVVAAVAEVLEIPAGRVDADERFADMGLDSVLSVEIARRIGERLGVELRSTELFNHSSIADLERFLARTAATSAAGAEEVVVLPATPPAAARVPIAEAVAASVAAVLEVDGRNLDQAAAFSDFGVDSVLAVEIINRINQALGADLRSTDLFNYASIQALAEHLERTLPVVPTVPESPARPARVGDAGALFASEAATSDFPDLDEVGAEPRTAAPRRPDPRSDSVQEEPAAAPPLAADPAPAVALPGSKPDPAEDAVAIIGMSGRFPGANDTETFWTNLRGGQEAVRAVPPGRWDLEAFFAGVGRRSEKPFPDRAGLLDDVDAFDSLFFGISPKEAEMMDPQQRIFLEEAWKAFEDAGQSQRMLSERRCGVYVGCGAGDYRVVLRQAGVLEEPFTLMGNSLSILPARVSYLLNLRGPSIALDTACSSSLVAVHLAWEAIRSGSLDMAIAGGTMVLSTAEFALLANEAGMLSPDGRCKAFADDADGFVPAEGVGAVVLKALSAALRDGDPVLGVIRGSAVNQDGKTNGITAPSGPSQTALELEVYERSGISPALIDYVEAHGTGTRLGDPIEIEALTDAFRRYTDARQCCAIGSVKSNIGHAAMAAGVAGLIKVLLSLEHGEIPPSLHFSRPNAHIPFESTPFFVAREVLPWGRRPDRPRRAVVSSFGFSGTNAHLLVEEAPTRALRAGAPEAPGRASQPIVLSARTDAALRRRLRDLLRWTEVAPESVSLADVAHTLLCRRTPLPVRVAFVASSFADLRARLAALAAEGPRPGDVLARDLKTEPATIEPLHEELGRRMVAEVAVAAPEADMGSQLRALCDLFVRGYDLRWADLFPGARAVRLPTYPFERQRHWAGRPLAASDVETMPAPTARPRLTAPAAGKDAFLALEKGWAPVPWPDGAPVASGTFVVLANAESVGFASRLAAGALPVARDAAARWVVVEPGARFELDGGRARIDFAEVEDGRRLAERVLATEPRLAGVLDLSDLFADSREVPGPSAGKIALLQSLVRAAIEGRREEPLLLLHFTRGLSGFGGVETSLAGAVMAGLMRAVAAEYQRVVARSIDLDFGPERAPELASTIDRELRGRDTIAEICVRGGTRYAPVLSERLRVPAPALATSADTTVFPADKVLVITGGTGGLGRTLARRWVERGARKLAVLGLDSVPPRSEWADLLRDPGASADRRARVRDLLALEEAGCAVELYLGHLTDRPALESFFDGVRRRLGPIGGVFHCAGAFVEGHPPFVRRDLADVPRVLEPKVDGLLALEAALAVDAPDFFVLFSSISALFPSLAIGIADYSMANAFLASFAEHQFRKGRRHYQALLWSNWREVGIGEVDNPNYRQLGLRTHSTAEGLAMLDRAGSLLGQAPGLALSLLEEARLSPERLLGIRQDQQEKAQFVRVDEAVRKQVEASGELDEASRGWLRGLFARELKMADEALDDRARFEELGIDSILMVDLLKKIEKALGRTVDPTAFLEYPTLAELGKYLQVKHGTALYGLPETATPAREDAEKTAGPPTRPGLVAVIGMACHFPASPDKDAFWANLAAGYSGITVVPPSRWDAEQLYRAAHEPNKSISKWGGFIEGIESFDAGYFGLREEVAPQVDPLIRQFLEAAVQCVRDAGYAEPELSRARVGVFVGSRISTYARRIDRAVFDTVVGVGQNFIASHVSHLLNLRGPSLVVDTACSSSLVSLHLACASLLSGESDLALAGGVDLLLDEIPYLTLSESRALSPDGRCFTFDERANGFVPGEGCGAVLLKPLHRALADGDRVYAVIEGSALNNDGRTMGITTPNPEAQSEVVLEALRKAGVRADAVGYVEAHGTGTMIGDPIELRGLSAAFRAHTEETQFCAVGSVKSNIGHLFSAAGIASFIKVALCLHHKKLVPTVNCDRPNPRFAFARSPFYPNLELRDWQPRQGVRRAGISSFGFGGTNAHLIVREPGAEEATSATRARPALPPAAFNRKRYWLERPVERRAPGTPAAAVEPAADEPLPDLLEMEWVSGSGQHHANGAVAPWKGAAAPVVIGGGA